MIPPPLPPGRQADALTKLAPIATMNKRDLESLKSPAEGCRDQRPPPNHHERLFTKLEHAPCAEVALPLMLGLRAANLHIFMHIGAASDSPQRQS